MPQRGLTRGMEPIRYGPFARLSDLYHGWRDGLSSIPPKDHWRRGQRITTPHREVLIRRAQDSFELERLRFEETRRSALDRLARSEAERAGAEAALALAERELSDASVPPGDEQLRERRAAEAYRDEGIVRARRMREHHRRRAVALAAVRRAHAEVTGAEARIAGARQEATTQLVVAASRVRRIHEFTHRRLAAYRRRLARSHPDPAWIVEGMSVLEPAIPGWAFSPYPGHELEAPPGARPAPDEPEPEAEPEPPAERIELSSAVRFGSDPDRADVVLPWFWVAPHHFTVVPGEGHARLLDRGHGNGPFVDGRPVRAARLLPGEYFDFGDLRYEVSDDASALLVSPLAAPELVVHDLADSAGSRLRHMSFVQHNRTVVAILGPSGAGKSSLFSALLNELETTSGRLYFRHLSLVAHREEIRTMLGFVPQDDEMYRSLTVRQLLSFADQLRSGPDHRGKRTERIEQTCAVLGLSAQVDQLVRTLSGGQRKRVSIALEMIARPELLMLDEPTSGLDPNMDREVMTILRDYAERDRTVIVITHNTEHLRLAHRVLVLARGGRPVYYGRPGDALRALHVRSWADLMKLLAADGGHDADRLATQYRDGPAAREAEREADRIAGAMAKPNEAVKARRSARPLHREFAILSRRQLALLWAQRLRDRDGNKPRATGPWSWLKPLAGPAVVAMPLLIAVFGALLSALIAGHDGFGPPSGPRQTPSPAAALSLLTTLCMLNGQALTYSNVVSEWPVIRREHRTGVRPLSVLLSKWWVFALIGIAQAGIITTIFCALLPAPRNYLVYGGGTVELFADLATLTVASMSLGLLISALARRLEQAVAWVTAASIAQIALNGVTADLSNKGWFLNLLTYLLPSRMGLAATASSIGLRGIAPNTAYSDALWTHATGQWVFDTGLVLAQTGLFFGLAARQLRRRLNHPDQ
ncbi:ATP-binding cassette domain-containing protein [Dactylosporangium sp. CA-092794]|uniref:ATP-binding cassette domain-containing protein n=1 Tax=Dactylosporangium sp. CA-092794 TaxID=3239929 RepID=UPI003D8A9011